MPSALPPSLPYRHAALALFCSTCIDCASVCSKPLTEQPASAATRGAIAMGAGPRVHYLLKRDADVMVKEPAPHQGVGETTAYRYFDELEDAALIFRKRALHRGAANGVNVLQHDEVYYALRGRGELEVDGAQLTLEPGTAVFMYRGATIRLRQVGEDDLVVIIAYPPAERPR